MWVPGQEQHYLGVGREAADLVGKVLEVGARKGGGRGPWRILDLGCGHGRVLRHLVGPGREVVAGDRDPEAVAFCGRYLGAAAGVVLEPGAEDPGGEAPFDLVWAGSLWTHLSPEAGRRLLERVADWLCPGGSLLISAHGPSCLGHPDLYPVPLPGDGSVPTALEEEGAFHMEYPWEPGYGITLLTRAWVEGALPPFLELVEGRERGWDRHQDVYRLRRRG